VVSILPLPLAGVVGIFSNPTPITVRTPTVDVDDEGLPDTTATVSRSLTAVCHPASGRDVERVEPGRRTRAQIWLFTNGAVNVGDKVDYQRPSDPSISEWLVISSESWIQISGHYRCLAIAP
jgi:hypothetical protein